MQNFNMSKDELRTLIASIEVITESKDFEQWLDEIEAEGLLTLVGSFRAWEKQKTLIAIQEALITALRARIRELESNEGHLNAKNKGLSEAVVKLKEEFGLDH